MFVFKKTIRNRVVIQIDADKVISAVQGQILYPAVYNSGACRSGDCKRAACHGTVGKQFGFKTLVVGGSADLFFGLFFRHVFPL